MITYLEGDIFSSPAQVIVNAVNTVGVMGKGIALAFKNRYPKMFEVYKDACEKKKFQMGKLMLCHAPDHLILLFPTKENWRNPSKLEYIEKGLDRFVKNYAEKNISSIAFPKLGCGNGELKWEDVKPLMEKYLKPLPIDVYIYLGSGDSFVPEHKQPKEMQKWLRENAKDMSFNGLIDDISSQATLLPYAYNVDGAEIMVYYKDGLHFQKGKEKIDIDEDQFFMIWDYIRTHNMFTLDEEKDGSYLIYELLVNLGYLSKIKILNKSANKFCDGYQLNEGLGRAFIFQEG